MTLSEKTKLYFSSLTEEKTTSEVGGQESISHHILDDISKCISIHLENNEIKDIESFERDMEEHVSYFNTRSYGIDPRLECIYLDLIETFISDHHTKP